MLNKILEVSAVTIFLVKSFIALVETAGNGPAKKAAVIAAFKDAVAVINNTWPMPSFIFALIQNEVLIGILIDLTIVGLNMGKEKNA